MEVEGEMRIWSGLGGIFWSGLGVVMEGEEERWSGKAGGCGRVEFTGVVKVKWIRSSIGGGGGKTEKWSGVRRTWLWMGDCGVVQLSVLEGGINWSGRVRGNFQRVGCLGWRRRKKTTPYQ